MTRARQMQQVLCTVSVEDTELVGNNIKRATKKKQSAAPREACRFPCGEDSACERGTVLVKWLCVHYCVCCRAVILAVFGTIPVRNAFCGAQMMCIVGKKLPFHFFQIAINM